MSIVFIILFYPEEGFKAEIIYFNDLAQLIKGFLLLLRVPWSNSSLKFLFILIY